MEIVVISLVIILYFLPSLIGGNKRNSPSIFFLNLLLGWTFVGWVVALVWAMSKEAPVQKERVIIEQAPYTPAQDHRGPAKSIASELKELQNMRDQGLLNEHEFAQAKAKLLA